MPPRLLKIIKIGSGFPQRTDPAAMVIGPTGLGLAPNGTLYVANSLASAINAIPGAVRRPNSAGTGTKITSGGALNTPLGLIIAPNGDVLTVNGGERPIGRAEPVGDAGGQEDARLLGQPARRRGPVWPGPGPEQRGRVLRGRRGQHAASAALGLPRPPGGWPGPYHRPPWVPATRPVTPPAAV